MNHDMALIAKVLETRDLSEAVREGASPDMLGEEAQIYWDIIASHHDRFNEVPTVTMFRSMVAGYEHTPPDDSIQSIIHQLKTKKLGNDIEKALLQVAEVNQSDPWKAKKNLVKLTDHINVRNQAGNTDIVAGTDQQAVFDTLERIRTGQGLLGYEWPWAYMNERTTGLCPGHVVYIYGRQKSKKTFLMLWLALFYWSMGLRVLFFGRDTPLEELKWRTYAMACGFDWGNFLKGEIPSQSDDFLQDTMQKLADSNRMIFTEQGEGVAGFKSKVEELKPDVVFHDYWKSVADDEMPDKSNAREHVYVSRTVDRLCDYTRNKKKIPFFMCGHANREGEKSAGYSSTEHAWSDHITRRVDAALRVICANDQRMGIVVNEGRSIRRHIGFTIDGTLCRGFGDFLNDDVSWVEMLANSQRASDDSKDRNKPVPQGTGKGGGFKKSDWKGISNYVKRAGPKIKR